MTHEFPQESQNPKPVGFEPRREDFALGERGDVSYLMIKNGAQCGVIIGEIDGRGVRCGQPATLILNFRGHFDGADEYLPACDPFHAIKAAHAIGEELLMSEGRETSFTINGGKEFIFDNKKAS